MATSTIQELTAASQDVGYRLAQIDRAIEQMRALCARLEEAKKERLG